MIGNMDMSVANIGMLPFLTSFVLYLWREEIISDEAAEYLLDIELQMEFLDYHNKNKIKNNES